jgi:hypothetical protein
VYDEGAGTEVLLLFFVPRDAAGLAHLHERGILLDGLRRLVLNVRSPTSTRPFIPCLTSPC